MSGPNKAAALLITADLPPDVFAYAEGLRQRYFPPERNRLRAHVTLFHALPPSANAEVRRLLADFAKANKPPPAQISGLMDLDTGTALEVRSKGMEELRDELAGRLHGLLGWRDDRRLRLHITIQNKVDRAVAKALQAELAETLDRRRFRFHGFGLDGWEDPLWTPIANYPFRG